MIKAVIFDMDGVIIDSEVIYAELLCSFLERRGYDIPEAQLNKLVGLSSAQGEALLNHLCGAEPGLNVWKTYLEECEGYDIDYKSTLLPGVKALLELLKAEGIKTGLASASDMKDIRQVLESTSLQGYFEVILSGEMFHESKPNPEIYCRAMDELKTAPEECIIIEDSVYGIAAGKAAGGYVIAVEDKRFGFDQSQADVILSDMTKIGNVIKGIVSR